ncbi:MAG: hypothetical protein U5K76_09895 [Woeseiaceae bacterium]|nr:hypothetical protein [Woeseiaceae bacterium]
MADYRDDEQDRVLRRLLAHPPLPDAGFSERIVRRLRRRQLLRRFLLPLAVLAGGLVAVKPASELLVAGTAWLTRALQGVDAVPGQLAPLAGYTLSGAIALVAIAAALRLLDD